MPGPQYHTLRYGDVPTHKLHIPGNVAISSGDDTGSTLWTGCGMGVIAPHRLRRFTPMIKRKFVLPCLLALNLCFLSATAMAATLRVGAARIDITPPRDPAHPPSGKYEHERL